ncbi:MaoC/PaaZ C-terminal domain-containing protein [Sneathiella sp.]|uniref:MaoC/PaaZ C-terminal domain-containing protein n=1 Tax=Sneathiella sp. TaxID=1964365 RepID=UPI002FE2F327
METLGLGLHYEDLPIGRSFRTIARTITEADIVNFVGATGMTEVLFTDLEYLAHHSDIKGGRVAPGALVYSIAEGLVLSASLQHTGVAFLGMELNVAGPVIAGDTIHVECEVVEARLTSKRGRGLVRTRNRIVNQRGQTVIEYTPLRLVKCRNGS